ncbi:MAG TPA: hypothetical protein ENK18_27940 [Deltaproteobacteria bacterium]|nr:hypothetical protein [Deltaproteobacteria bacterium]
MAWRDRFSSIENGTFLLRHGPAIDRIYPDRKICFFARDPELLGEILDRLADRPDCAAVGLAVEPRDEIYLGRAFFDGPEVVGEVWAAHKAHPRLHCSVHDDRLTAGWRAKIQPWPEAGSG